MPAKGSGQRRGGRQSAERFSEGAGSLASIAEQASSKQPLCDNGDPIEAADASMSPLLAECICNIILFIPGHSRRAVSKTFRDRLDHLCPVRTLGPPLLPARVLCSELVGTSRVAYGQAVSTYKTVCVASVKRVGALVSSRGRWDRGTVTTSTVSYGQLRSDPGTGCVAGGAVEGDTPCDFWRAVLRFLRENDPGNGGGTMSSLGSETLPRELRICLGDSQQHSFDFVTRDLLAWINTMESCAEA
eukprot:TRINITY_DN26266_c0_g1_i1.p1 TRINITY_DN26266_c0_g1~~TRINITY_DN26266_c0_g1_i1.p1  ORF type:complete len:277 (-),score=22.16 TRINITY_DN26266_c0_g1_i1:81-815(-)